MSGECMMTLEELQNLITSGEGETLEGGMKGQSLLIQ